MMYLKQHNRRCQRGIALIVVMIAVTVLSIMAALFAFSMKVETRLAQNANSEMEVMWLGRSGVEMARWILANDPPPQEGFTSLMQIWAGGPGSPASSNGILAGFSYKEPVKLGNGQFQIVKITELESKFNINIADQAILDQAMRLVGVDSGEAAAVTASIMDWIDPDNSPSPGGGAESEHYQTLEPPYFAKNQPFDDLSELLLIRGVTPEMYWGGVSTNRTRAAFQSRMNPNFARDTPQHFVGLVELFTPISSGRLNINTATMTTLQLLPFVDEIVAAKIIELRSGPDGMDGTEDDMPAGAMGIPIPDVLRSAGLNQNVVQLAAGYCTARGAAYEVKVDATIGGYTRKFTAILGRVSARDVQVLSFYMTPEE